jgi:hypothetical protein
MKAQVPLEPCGIHTILNGWAVAMGLEHHIDVKKKTKKEDYMDAVTFIELALSGYCDFWLISLSWRRGAF